MNSPAAKKTDGSWSRSSKLMLLVTFVLLIGFSVWSSFAKRSRQKLVDGLQHQYELGKSQLKELEDLHQRHNQDTVYEFDRISNRLIEMHKLLDTKEDLFPILENEFVVLHRNGDAESGEKLSLLAVPNQGKHQLGIELWRHQKRFANEIHKVEAGKGYVVRFKVAPNSVEVRFPNAKPVQYDLEDFNPHNVRTAGIQPPRSHLPFVSVNRPSWSKGLVYFSPVKKGVLHEFRFESRGFGIDDGITVRIVAESDGPSSAAADDLQTVSKLLESLEGLREPVDFRFENGRYVFDQQ